MSNSGKPQSENIYGYAAMQELTAAIKKLVQSNKRPIAEQIAQQRIDAMAPDVDPNECLNPTPPGAFEGGPNSFKELGELMAKQVHDLAYDPIPDARSVRGMSMVRNARGDFDQRFKVDADFRANCESYAKHVGQSELIERLNRSHLFRDAAADLNIPIETVSFSQAVANWDRKQMKVMLSLAGNNEMPMPQVICGFPGVGKSTLFRNRGDQKILDSDSSTFDKAEFPQNYIAHIREKIAEGYTILASTHDVVRAALVENGIPFAIVYPALNCKDEYLQRYRDRGSPQGFVDLMDAKWVDFVNGCAAQKGCISYCMPQGAYMPTMEELPKLLR